MVCLRKFLSIDVFDPKRDRKDEQIVFLGMAADLKSFVIGNWSNIQCQ